MQLKIIGDDKKCVRTMITTENFVLSIRLRRTVLTKEIIAMNVAILLKIVRISNNYQKYTMAFRRRRRIINKISKIGEDKCLEQKMI